MKQIISLYLISPIGVNLDLHHQQIEEILKDNLFQTPEYYTWLKEQLEQKNNKD
jgi:hypothetical protein